MAGSDSPSAATPPRGAEAPAVESLFSRPPIDTVVRTHVEDAMALSSMRFRLIRCGHAKTLHLTRVDVRLRAHLDGITIAGIHGARLCEQALEAPDSGRVFVAVVRAIQDRDAQRLEKLAALAEAVPETITGILSAFGWVPAEALRGITVQLLSSDDPLRRSIGLAACAVHEVDPGKVLEESLQHPNPILRARALRVAAEAGRKDLLEQARHAMRDEAAEVRCWAAWAACLLGDRERSIAVLAEVARSDERFSRRALRLVALAASFEWTHEFLGSLPPPEQRDLPTTRKLIRASGLSGNVTYVPWLIRQMEDDKLARICGEAFSFVSGADLALLDLERRPPEKVESGPSDDPEDDDVGMDEDDGLPWPDRAKVEAWWNANQQRFQPGVRHFIGAPPSWEHCLHVLKTGYQRQRIAAAHYLCLLRSGTPMFNTSAPAWRQKRRLDAMT